MDKFKSIWKEGEEVHIVRYVEAIAQYRDRDEQSLLVNDSLISLQKIFDPYLKSRLSRILNGRLSIHIEDILQVAWWTFYSKVEPDETIAKPINAAARIARWLYRVSSNAAIDLRNDEMSYVPLDEAPLWPTRQVECHSSEKTFFAHDDVLPLRNLVHKAMSHIAALDRIIILLHDLGSIPLEEIQYLLGAGMPSEADRVTIDQKLLDDTRGKHLTHTEIARILHLSPVATRARYSRALKRIQKTEGSWNLKAILEKLKK